MKYKAIAIKQRMSDDELLVGILHENEEVNSANEAIGGAIQMSQFQGKEIKIGWVINCETGKEDMYCAITIECVPPGDTSEYIPAYAVVPQEMDTDNMNQLFHLLELQNH